MSPMLSAAPSAIQLWTAFMTDERRDERACSGLSDAFAERHARPNHGASSHSLRRASPLRSGSAVRSTAVSSPRHNKSHSGDSQLSLLAPATMNLIRVIRSAGRRRRRRPGAATSQAYLSLLLSPWGREKTRQWPEHAVLIMHRTDIRTHRDGWVVVERHKRQGHHAHDAAPLTLHTLTSHVVCHRILVFATMRAAPRR
jgi:hypothetical protein